MLDDGNTSQRRKSMNIRKSIVYCLSDFVCFSWIKRLVHLCNLPFHPLSFIMLFGWWGICRLRCQMGLIFCQEVNCSSSEAWGHAACGTYPDTTWQQPIGQRQSDKHHHTAKHLQDRRHAAISVWPVQVVEACWSLVLLFCRIAPPTWLVKQKQASLILMQLVSICNMYQLVTALAISMSDYWVTKCY